MGERTRRAAAQSERANRQRGWGGRRKGAGRPKTKRLGSTPHVKRPRLAKRRHIEAPIPGSSLVTVRVRRDVASLRRGRSFRVIYKALCAARELGFIRIVDYSVMSNHIHLIVEADGARDLSRGMQSLCIRIARGLNRVQGRSGKVFTDRYHSRPILSPKQGQYARIYVVNNARKHRRVTSRRWLDEYSSAGWFEAWEHPPTAGQLAEWTRLRHRARAALERAGPLVVQSVRGRLRLDPTQPETKPPLDPCLADAFIACRAEFSAAPLGRPRAPEQHALGVPA